MEKDDTTKVTLIQLQQLLMKYEKLLQEEKTLDQQLIILEEQHQQMIVHALAEQYKLSST